MLKTVAAIVAAAGALAWSAPATAQTTSMTGRVTTIDGRALAGVSVSAIRQDAPRADATRTATTATTSSGPDGRWVIAGIAPGMYTVTFAASGYRTTMHQQALVDGLSSATVDAVLARWATSAQTWNRDALDRVTTASDPWAVATLSPAVVFTATSAQAAINVGGEASVQQLDPNARGVGRSQASWRLDGTSTTDLVAIGGSLRYYDFGALDTISVVAAGAGLSFAASGPAFVLTTSSGTNRLGGAARGLWSDQHLQSSNISQSLFNQGSGPGVPLRHFHEFGGTVGGPLVRDRLWWWAAASQQQVSSTVLNFNAATSSCDTTSFAALDTAEECLYPIDGRVNTATVKVTARLKTSHRITLAAGLDTKELAPRDATADTPLETTSRQHGRSPHVRTQYSWASADHWSVTANGSWSDDKFVLDFLRPSLADVPVQRITNSLDGTLSGSLANANDIRRPSMQLNGSTSFSAGSAALRQTVTIGGGYERAKDWEYTTVGGGAYLNYSYAGAPRPSSAWLYRDGLISTLQQLSNGYAQYEVSGRRYSIAAGVRLDHQDDSALPTAVPAQRWAPNTIGPGTFSGFDPNVDFTDVGPRVNGSVDLFGTGRTIVSGSYNWYFGQGMTLAGLDFPTRRLGVTAYWKDLAHTGDLSSEGFFAPITLPSSWDPSTGTLRSLGNDRFSSDLRNRRTREWIARLDHSFSDAWRAGAAYISRIDDRFSDDLLIQRTSSDYRRYLDIYDLANRLGVYEYVFQKVGLTTTQLGNQSGRTANYRGLELTASGVMRRWRTDLSFLSQRAIAHWPPSSYVDPTNIDQLDGADADPNLPRFVARATTTVQLPVRSSVSATLNVQGGLVRNEFFKVLNGYAYQSLLLVPQGQLRYPDIVMLDLRADKDIPLGRSRRLTVTAVLFNALNAATVTGRGNEFGSLSFDRITGMVGPRVLRLGAAFNF